LDADQDARTDLLLFTRDKPMMMLHAEAEGFKLTESKDMGQFGLVKAASADNTAVFDIDGDGQAELLIADSNFVRAVRYEPQPPAGISPGWQVAEQINASDSASKLVSLAVLGRRIVAADRENDRLIIMAPDADHTGRGWRATESINVKGFDFHSIHAGSLRGDGHENILAIGNDGFGVIRLAGSRTAFREFASWRTDEEQRRQHELTTGDVNGDGFTDLIALDAGEQMCEIFTISEAGRLLYATGFQVFESKIFSGGEPREYEPSDALVADVTGDGADDLVLLAHDRILIYPQMTGHSRARSSRAGEQ
ncbi:MAG: FG-GAP repeat domain-containing protein, partial [Planctomycetota bacterium]